MKSLVAVTGTIGAGATTLSKRLTEMMGWRPTLEEDVESSNPFFALYNESPDEYAFHNQVTFLTQSAESHLRLRRENISDDVCVQDFTPFEHTEVYAFVQWKLGNLTEQEYTLLSRLTSVLSAVYVTPAVLVYRQIPHSDLLHRVQERARPSELALPQVFLEAVDERFRAWSSEWNRSPIIIVPADIDVRTNDEVVRGIGAEILTKLNSY